MVESNPTWYVKCTLINIEYRKFFWSQDRDGDGQLSRAEFTSMLGKMGLDLSHPELNKLFSKTDVDRK